MSNIIRYRVRTPHKSWSDYGPDLLRPKINTRQQMATILRTHQGPFEYRISDGEWAKGPGRTGILEAFDNAGRFKKLVVRKKDGGLVLVVKREIVPLLDSYGGSMKVNVARSLIEYQFPGIRYAGAYVWKETYPGYWSDHAWGDAVDESHNPREGVLNDDVTYWVARMGKYNCMKYDYAIGSRDGKVVSVSGPEYKLLGSGASDSHLWHVHTSTVDHDGAKPPKQGGHRG